MSNLLTPQGFTLPQRKVAMMDKQQSLTALQTLSGALVDAHNAPVGNLDASGDPGGQPIFDLLDFIVVFRAPTADVPTSKVQVDLSDASAGGLGNCRVYESSTPTMTYTASTNTFNVFTGQVVLTMPFFRIVSVETKNIATQYVTVNYLLSSR